LKAKNIISENIVETPIEVLCEVVFVLTRIYDIARKDIADTLKISPAANNRVW
jgi:predicted nucleic-acid-binding protein